MKRMKLVLPAEKITVVAELLESEAPRTCAAIWQSLPHEGPLNHGIWSGPETYLMIDPSIRIEPENQAHHMQAGDIGYYTVRGGAIVDWPDDLSELAFFYGRGARPYMPTGPVSVNYFARVIDNLEGFASACDSIRTEGRSSLRVEQVLP